LLIEIFLAYHAGHLEVAINVIFIENGFRLKINLRGASQPCLRAGEPFAQMLELLNGRSNPPTPFGCLM
jgi:hypothetical protein